MTTLSTNSSMNAFDAIANGKREQFSMNADLRRVGRNRDFETIEISPLGIAKKQSIAAVAQAIEMDLATAKKNCEAYGRKVICYLHGKGENALEDLAYMSDKLAEIGVPHTAQIYRDPSKSKASRLTVPVTYFKAHGWNQ